jgi:signal transduction histidine kinase
MAQPEAVAAAAGGAVRATPGVLHVSIAAAAAAQDAGRPGAVIQFRDSGPGVPGELREQIFNPFFTTKPTGVGLGLAIVSKIIDQHGGNVRLRDDAGDDSGATFEVFLPYVHHPDRG